jgi:predicted flap endonuclease-1-like 5' DNA nuclease
MSFLLAKILFLLLLAALLGAWFGYWWVRRQYDDVTGEYSRLKSDWQAWRKGFEEKLAARPEVDLKPLTTRIDDVPGAVRGVLFPFQERLSALESAVGAIRIPASKDVDLGPLQQRLAELERAVRAIVIPPLDLTPVIEKLDALARTSAPMPAVIAPAPPPAVAPAPAISAVVRHGSRNLLAHAAFGTPDDLKLIKGVAGVMERMLHDIGVYYFWQIAEWTPTDVAHADAQLTAFRGRIERDHWVQQATQFAARTQSARKPDPA